MSETYLLHPVIHHLGHIDTYTTVSTICPELSRTVLTACLLNALPEIPSNAVRKEMLLEIDGNTLQEFVFANIDRQHAEY